MQAEYTALMRAAEEGFANCVELLLEVGAEKDAKQNVRDIVTFVVVFSNCFYFCFDGKSRYSESTLAVYYFF